MLPKVSIKITDSKKGFFGTVKDEPVGRSSVFLRMASESISADRINRYGDKGQPCLTPRLRYFKELLARPLFKIQLSILQ